MGIGNELVDFLRTRQSLREPFLSALGGGDQTITAYYLCPLSTLPRILAEGIRCRNAGNLGIDLAASEVQARRKTVSLARRNKSEARAGVGVHDSVNLFWNPINLTFWAFQRNALIRGTHSGSAADQTVCILEVDAERLLREGLAFWCATSDNVAKNFAKDAFTLDVLRRFDWQGIFANGAPAIKRIDRRAAELIVFFDDPVSRARSAPLPPKYIRRVILPPDKDLPCELQSVIRRDKASSASVFKPAIDLLRTESYFLSTLCSMVHKDWEARQRICFAIEQLNHFELLHGGPVESRFLIRGNSHGPHGAGHAVRVMFWSALLASYEPEHTDQDFLDSLLMAAMVHDLCRSDDGEDEAHGAVAAAQWATFVRQRLANGARSAACLNAIIMHCQRDNACLPNLKDPIWRILKDADALDRGRFNTPGWPGGCDPAQLRSEWARCDDVQWLAYRLCKMSRYTKWEPEPCASLGGQLGSGILAALSKGILSPAGAASAHALLSWLPKAT